METKASIYIPQVFRDFPGFLLKDIKEWRSEKRMQLVLERGEEKTQHCNRCNEVLGSYKDQYRVVARHMRIMDWMVELVFFREKRHCPKCCKVRSERIEFICDETPHISRELAWWMNRLTEMTSVLAVSRLENIDKMTCYKVDKQILKRLLQGYKIPKITQISVDEVYARSKRQQKEDETRDDLFLTVIVDLKTRKVVWVSQSRRREALDQFFTLLGEEGCKGIEVVATDQHEAYSASVKQYCPQAIVVWDRFHIVQKFNEALNQERKDEQARLDPEGEMEDLINGKYRYIFLTKSKNRNEKDKRHLEEVMRINNKMARLEVIKEHFHKIFDCVDELDAKQTMVEVLDWAIEIKAIHICRWIFSIVDDQRLWNYFKYKVTTGVSEGINRAIKGIKWQAYGYKDMEYFALKILQKVGYLNYRFILSSHK